MARLKESARSQQHTCNGLGRQPKKPRSTHSMLLSSCASSCFRLLTSACNASAGPFDQWHGAWEGQKGCRTLKGRPAICQQEEVLDPFRQRRTCSASVPAGSDPPSVSMPLQTTEPASGRTSEAIHAATEGPARPRTKRCTPQWTQKRDGSDEEWGRTSTECCSSPSSRSARSPPARS